MYAIIKIGGLQYPVEVNKLISVNRLFAEVGTDIEVSDVLFIKDDSAVKVGKPLVAGAKVICEVTEHFRNKKIIVFKKKRRKKYRLKQGHRQDMTKLRIKSINA